MRWSEPQNIHEALGPLLEGLCWMGLGTFQRRGQRLKFLSVVYRALLLIVFLTCFFMAEFKTTAKDEPYWHNSVVNLVYMLRIYCNVGVVSLLLGLGHFVHGITHASIKRMIAHDYAMMALGVTFDYRTFKRISTIAFSLVTAVVIAYCAVASTVIVRYMPHVLDVARYLMSQYYPFIVSLLANTIFVAMTFSIARRFRKINDLLETIVDQRNVKESVRRGTLQEIDREPMIAKPAWTIGLDHGLNCGSSKKVDHTPLASSKLLRRIRVLHRELCGIARAMNRAYSLQLLFFSVITFTLITTNMYYLYIIYLMKDFKNGFIFITLSWSLLYAGVLLGVAATAEYCMNEVKRTGNLIHEIITYDDPAMREEVHGFSLQLINQPLQFTACGFFPIDYTLVRNMCGSITTYLIILIQMSKPGDLLTPGISNNSTTLQETKN